MFLRVCGNFYLLIVVQDFDELLHIAEQGDHRNIDMLVGDIYGGTHKAYGLPADLIASSFGKAARSVRDDIGIVIVTVVFCIDCCCLVLLVQIGLFVLFLVTLQLPVPPDPARAYLKVVNAEFWCGTMPFPSSVNTYLL